MRILLLALIAALVPVELVGQDRQPPEPPLGSLTAQVIRTVRSWAPQVPVLLDRSNPFNRDIPPGRTEEIEATGQRSNVPVVSLTAEWQCGKNSRGMPECVLPAFGEARILHFGTPIEEGSELRLPVTMFSQEESAIVVTELLAIFDRGPGRSATLREIKTLSTS